MIVRIWHGCTAPEHADADQQLLDEPIVPNIIARRISGLRGVDILPRTHGDNHGETATARPDWADDHAVRLRPQPRAVPAGDQGDPPAPDGGAEPVPPPRRSAGPDRAAAHPGHRLWGRRPPCHAAGAAATAAGRVGRLSHHAARPSAARGPRRRRRPAVCGRRLRRRRCHQRADHLPERPSRSTRPIVSLSPGERSSPPPPAATTRRGWPTSGGPRPPASTPRTATAASGATNGASR